MLPESHYEKYSETDDATAETARELYWRDFQDKLAWQASRVRGGWPRVLDVIQMVMRRGSHDDYRDEVEIDEFAKAEGWPNVLRAAARAMEEQK